MNGRYWFPIFVSPIRMLEQRAREIDDMEAMAKVKAVARRLLVNPPEVVISGGRGRVRPPPPNTPFSIGKSTVLTDPEPIDHDDRDYIVVAVLTPLDEHSLEKVIYETPTGGTRTYANTICVAFPSGMDKVEPMVSFAKKMLAYEEIKDGIDELYQDEDVRRLVRSKLESHIKGAQGVEGKLAQNILDGLDMVAYPHYRDEGGIARNTVGVVKALGNTNIIEKVSETLERKAPPKVYNKNDLDYPALDLLLSGIGIDISNGERERLVQDIIDYFYTNPKLPIVRKEKILDALSRGVERLEIGIRSGGRVFFKRVVRLRDGDCDPSSLPVMGSPPDRVEPSDSILPWRLALEEQIRSLEGVWEKKVGDKVIRSWYGFCIRGSGVIPVSEALDQYDPALLRDVPLVEVVEEYREGVRLILERSDLLVRPGESVEISVTVERVGDFAGDVYLEVEAGEVIPNRIHIDGAENTASIAWKLEAPVSPGRYEYAILARDSAGKELMASTVTLTVQPEEIVIDRPGWPPPGEEVSRITVKVDTNDLRPIGILEKVFGDRCIVERASLEIEAEVGGRKPSISLVLRQVSLRDVTSSFPMLIHRYANPRGEVRYELVLIPSSGDCIASPRLIDQDLKVLERYVSYRGCGGR